MNPSVPNRGRLGAFLIPCILCLGSCDSQKSEPPVFPLERPDPYVHNILLSESHALRVQRQVVETLALLQPGDSQALFELLTDDFRGRFGSLAQAGRVSDSQLEIRVLGPEGLEPQDRGAFITELSLITGEWNSIDRRQFEFDRFFLAEDGERLSGRAELYLAGERRAGGRADLRLVAEVAFVRSEDTWLLGQLDLIEAVFIAGDVAQFRDISAATGFSFFESRANRAALQTFIDEHRVLALGGLSAVDWNRDGFVDVIGSLGGSLTTLFLNDGRGGFVPHELPIDEPADCGVFLLYVDLDGDGIEELVNSRDISYYGQGGYFGLYVREGDEWKQRPEALGFSNPVGLRGISVQTVVPFDANGDGLLDLFFGTYGTHMSRGDEFNLVEAHDGGRNYLFINQGNLEFREETAERGLSGVRFTYVGLPHDFDGDGDVDLFEGNDFGHNILWVNDGGGNFTSNPDSVFSRDPAYTMGITMADHDDDGRLSLYVVNMSSESGQRIGHVMEGISDEMRRRVLVIADGNVLYTQGEDGEWMEHAAAANCAEGEWGWGAMFFDLDGDGDEEIFATNGFTSHQDASLPDWDTYFWRQVAADAVAFERGEASFDVNAEYPFAGSYAGRQRDRLFYKADGDDDRFYDAAWHFGLDSIEDGRCVLPIDVDGDGDLDLMLWTLQGLRLYENTSPARPFARIHLRATESHPSALGARVRVRVGQRVQHDVVQLVEGFQSQQLLDMHFAWASAERIDEVQVTWPSGAVQSFKDLPLGERLMLTEGAVEVERTPVPRWDETCTPPRELALASDRSPVDGQLDRVIIRRCEEDPLAPWPARDALRSRHPDVEFQSSVWDAPQGTTYIHDRDGQLARAWCDAPSPQDLERFLVELAEEDLFPDLAILSGRRLLARREPGLALEHFKLAFAGNPNLPAAAEGMARAQRLLGNMQESESAYELSTRIDPDYALGHFNLAILRLRTGRAEESLRSFREALRIRGEHLETLLAMGEAAMVSGDKLLALEVFERAAKAAPKKAEALVLRGKLFGQLKRYEEARAAFTEALSRNPGNEDATRGLARALDLLGQ